MPKLDIEQFEQLLVKNNVEHDTIVKILTEAVQVIQENKEERQTGEVKTKFLYTVLLSDPENKMPADFQPVAWVVKHRDSLNVQVIPEKISNIANDYNSTKAGRRRPITKVSDVFESVKRKLWMKEDIFHCTKEPVLVLKTTNNL